MVRGERARMSNAQKMHGTIKGIVMSLYHFKPLNMKRYYLMQQEDSVIIFQLGSVDFFERYCYDNISARPI